MFERTLIALRKIYLIVITLFARMVSGWYFSSIVQCKWVLLWPDSSRIYTEGEKKTTHVEASEAAFGQCRNEPILLKDCEQFLVLTYNMVCPKYCPAKGGLWIPWTRSSWAAIILHSPGGQGNYLCHFSLLLLPSNFS